MPLANKIESSGTLKINILGKPVNAHIISSPTKNRFVFLGHEQSRASEKTVIGHGIILVLIDGYLFPNSILITGYKSHKA